jgi:hypothetical protein
MVLDSSVSTVCALTNWSASAETCAGCWFITYGFSAAMVRSVVRMSVGHVKPSRLNHE